VFTQLTQKLSRVSVSTRFVPEIDGLRFFAIGSVVLYHLLGIVSVRQFATWQPERFAAYFPLNWLTKGYFGVPLFFAISGFVLAMPFAEHYLHGREVLPLRSYYLRRLARLGPPYVLNLVFLFMVLISLGHLRFADWPHLLASICYVHDIAYGCQSTVNGVAWSLETEVQFYLVAPFLAAVLFRIPGKNVRRSILLGLILTASVAVEIFMPADVDRWNGDAWRMSLLNYLQYFLVGFLLVDFYLCDWRGKPASENRWAWDTVGVLAWIFLWSNVAGGALSRVLLPPAMLLAYVAAFRGRWLNAIVRNPLVFTVGGMCYTIYLWHQPIMMTWGKFGLRWTWLTGAPLLLNVAIQFAIGTLLVVGVGCVLFALTERPFMRKEWYRQWFVRQPVPAGNPASASFHNPPASGE
jgi:peptidoglycan/LPS O-acetylase OafA/YrhL